MNTQQHPNALLNAARDLFRISKLVAPRLDREDRICRVHMALAAMVPTRAESGIANAVTRAAEQELG